MSSNEASPEADVLSGFYCISLICNEFIFRHGSWISRNPFKTIAISLFTVFLCSLGLFRFNTEHDMVKLWLPRDSDFAVNNEWLWNNFPPDLRFNSIIIKAKNVLTPEVVQAMWALRGRVEALRTSQGRGWSDVCVRVPVVTEAMTSTLSLRRKRQLNFEDEFEDDFFEAVKSGSGLGESLDPSVAFYPDPYCEVVEAMKHNCYESSLLELFAVDGEFTVESSDIIANLTAEKLLELINEADFSSYLGGIQRDKNGQIVSAEATFMRWFGRADVRKANESRSLGLRVQPVDETTLEFEALLSATLNNQTAFEGQLSSWPPSPQ